MHKQRTEEEEEEESPPSDEMILLRKKGVRKQVYISVRVLGDVFRKALLSGEIRDTWRPAQAALRNEVNSSTKGSQIGNTGSFSTPRCRVTW